MNSFYLETTIKGKKVEEFVEREKVRIFKYVSRRVKKYLILCQAPEECITDEVIFKIEVKKEQFDELEIGHIVSIHLGVEYEYCCLHLDEPKTKITIHN